MADPVVAPVAPAVSPAVEGAAPPAVVVAPVTPVAGEPPALTAEPPKTELGKPPEKPAEPAPFDATKLTLPEGMKADDSMFKTFAETFGDAKLDAQARGQKLVDLYHQGIKSVKDSAMAAWTETNTKWVNEVKADAEIGGAKFEPTKAAIAKAIDSLGPELSVAFRQGLDATGAGNHPAIWKGLAKMAAALTEGGHVTGNPPSAPQDIGATFFPNSKMK
jgi:hypothetical protein